LTNQITSTYLAQIGRVKIHEFLESAHIGNR